MDNKTDKPQSLQKNEVLVCSGISIGLIALYFMPFGMYVLYPFMLIYTFVHELGHGIAAMMVGWEFEKLEIWMDGSGMARNLPLPDASRAAYAFVAFAGLAAPTVIAAFCFMLGRSCKASRIGLFTCAAVCVLSAIFFVHNTFGIVFAAVCAAISSALALNKNCQIPQYAMLAMAIVLLTAVFSQSDYLFAAAAQTAEGIKPSDVEQISKNLFLPTWFCGGLVAVISVAVLFVGIRAFFYRKPSKKYKNIQS